MSDDARCTTVLYSEPVIRGGRSYRGVVATDDPDDLVRWTTRDLWVVLYLIHGATPLPYHPEVDLYQVDPYFAAKTPHPQAHVIPRDFVDPGVFRPLSLEKRYDVVFNATWLWVKRPQLMIQALSHAEAAGRPIRCLWFGYHWHPGSVFIESLVVSEVRARRLPVDFLPPTSDLREVNRRINAARCAVLCSKSEAGPIVQAEAMLADLPYVTTRDTYGGSPDHVNGRNGLVCEPTPRSISEAIWSVSDGRSAYAPRAWALKHMCLPVARRRMVEALRRVGQAKRWRINLTPLDGRIDWNSEHGLVVVAERRRHG